MMVNLPYLRGSCPNFLRPTCSYTERRISFQTGSCPKERTTASYSSCLYLILPTSAFNKVLIFSGRFTLYLQLVFLLMQHVLCFIVSGFLSRTLLDFRFLWNPARVWNYNTFILVLLCCRYFLFLWVFYVLLTSFSDHMSYPWSGLYKSL